MTKEKQESLNVIMKYDNTPDVKKTIIIKATVFNDATINMSSILCCMFSSLIDSMFKNDWLVAESKHACLLMFPAPLP